MNSLMQNRYELLEKVGEGGMATVYKARCTLLDRIVAIKILKEEYARMTFWCKSLKARPRRQPGFPTRIS